MATSNDNGPWIAGLLGCGGTILAALISGIFGFWYIFLQKSPGTDVPQGNANENHYRISPTNTLRQTPLPTTPVVASPTQDERANPNQVTKNDFIFNLISCKSNNNEIVCEFTMKNNLARSRNVKFYSQRFNPYNTKLIDENGNSLKQVFITIANSKTERDWAEALIPREVTTSVRVVFLKESEVAKLALVRLGFEVEGEGDGFLIEFNNIPLN